MSIVPLITFKAGICDMTDDEVPKVQPRETPGYIYLYNGEDELIHFCWRERSVPITEPEVDLVMVPTDSCFIPYEPISAHGNPITTPITNGRIFILKFSSSSQRYLFWLQSHTQDPNDDPSWFSPRDIKLGHIVNMLLQGDEVNIQEELANIRNPPPDGDEDGDATMEDVSRTSPSARNHPGGGSGGAGADATGGDIRDEGEESREGGADGARAAAAGSQQQTDNSTSALVESFLASLQSRPGRQEEQSFLTLPALLTPLTTVPTLETASSAELSDLLSYLPPNLPSIFSSSTSSDLTDAQKKRLLEKVLRSPQFNQACSALTVALREGGLESICGAMGFRVQKSDGFGVEGFLEVLRREIEKEDAEQRARHE